MSIWKKGIPIRFMGELAMAPAAGSGTCIIKGIVTPLCEVTEGIGSGSLVFFPMMTEEGIRFYYYYPSYNGYGDIATSVRSAPWGFCPV